MVLNSAVHWNDNVIAAVAIRSTGDVPGYYDIYECTILIVDSMFRINKEASIFSITITPDYPERRLKNYCSDGKMQELMKNSILKPQAKGLFEFWFKKLKIQTNKKLMPLVHDWSYTKSFLVDWLGWDVYDKCFHPHVRDLISTGLFMNDRADMCTRQIPFPKTFLSFMGNYLGFNTEVKDSMSQCLAMVEIYKRMVMQVM